MITIFAVLVLIVLFAEIVKSKTISGMFASVTAIAVVLELAIDVGYFIKIGSFELGYSEIVIIFDVVLCFVFLVHSKVSRKKFLWGIFLILFALMSLIIQLLFPYLGEVVSASEYWDLYYFHRVMPGKIIISFNHIKEIFHLVCYVIIMIGISALDEEKEQLLLNKIYQYATWFIWFGIIELICTYFLHIQQKMIAIIKIIMGDSYFTDGSLLSIGTSTRLRGLKSEPSMYAYMLFVFLMFALMFWVKYSRRRDLYNVAICLVLMVASRTSSAIFCLFFLVVYVFLWLYQRTNNRTKFNRILFMFVIVFAGGLAILYIGSQKHFESYYLERIRMTLVSMLDLNINNWNGDYATYDGSTRIRLISIIETWKYFLKRPLFGLGLGSTYAKGTAITILASLGIFGSFAWYKFTFLSDAKKNGLVYRVACAIRIFMLFFVGAGLFPFYGLENIVVLELLSCYSSEQVKIDLLTKKEKFLHENPGSK